MHCLVAFLLFIVVNSVMCILDYEKETKTESAAKRYDLDSLGPTYGLIVNRLSMKDEVNEERTLREAFDENMLPERMADYFGDMPVKDGGPVHPSLQMLYSISGSKENTIDGTLIPTIPKTDDTSTAEYTDRATYFQGDVFDAMNAIKEGNLNKSESFSRGSYVLFGWFIQPDSLLYVKTKCPSL